MNYRKKKRSNIRKADAVWDAKNQDSLKRFGRQIIGRAWMNTGLKKRVAMDLVELLILMWWWWRLWSIMSREPKINTEISGCCLLTEISSNKEFKKCKDL